MSDDSSASGHPANTANSTAGACTDHWWAMERNEWVCQLCGKTEDPQPPNVVDALENALLKLIEHADNMEAQHQDYHQPEGPLRSQVLCEAMQVLE